jgi:ribonuclease HI
MGFWSPRISAGFQCVVKERKTSFYLEAYAVVCALSHASQDLGAPHHVVIYTDNTNTVQMFNSLHAKPDYNPILLTAVDIAITSVISFRVIHVPGVLNVVADALSRFKNGVAVNAAPGLTIRPFQPPQLTLGADLK